MNKPINDKIMFKHITTGIIFNNRLDCVATFGTSRYKRALKNKEFIFNYELKEGEEPIKVITRKEVKE